MRVVLAPDKFKGSLAATEVVDAVGSGVLAVKPDTDIVQVPGQPVSAFYARHDHQAVIELAGVCGLERLPGGRPDPLGHPTYGLGQVLAHAIAHGLRDVVLGLAGARPPMAETAWCTAGTLVLLTAGQALAGWFAGHHPTARH